MTPPKTKTAILLIIGMIILLFISTLFFSLFTITRLKSNLQIQVQTRTALITMKDNLTYLLDAETGERGFIITADSSYLDSYKLVIQNIADNTAKLKEFVKDHPVQQNNADSLSKYTALKLAYIINLIALKNKGDEESIRKIMISKKGKYYMDRIRYINSSMQAEEGKLFEKRSMETAKSIANASRLFIAEGILAVLITIFLAGMIIKELKKRTASERRIMEYNVELERKNREIEQFAFIASHDLQEPLRSITNFSTLLAQKIEDQPDKDAKQYMDLIRGSAVRMSNLIYDLLEYSRIGKDVSRSPIDCNKLVQEVLIDMSAIITETEVKFHVSKLPVVSGYVYLKSLFQNLISNAIKFTAKNVQPQVYISVIEKEQEFVFSIKDNGIGIEKSYQDRIFIIFQRLHTRTEYPGTGIGLSQCKKIVELHGGKIWVESEPGKGSIFNFSIPKT